MHFYTIVSANVYKSRPHFPATDNGPCWIFILAPRAVGRMTSLSAGHNHTEATHCTFSDVTDDCLVQEIAVLNARKQQYLMELGMMVLKARKPIPLSVIPHPLCNWKVSRISLIDSQIEVLKAASD